MDEDPLFAKPWLFLARIYEQKQEYTKCFEQLEKIKENNPENHNLNKYNQIKIKQQEEFEWQKNEAINGLKDLGNKFLGNFGISLDQFKLNQQPDGSYSVAFQNKEN